MFNKLKKSSCEDKLGILLFLFSFIFIGVMFWACFKISLTHDATFSLFLIQESYFNIAGMTMADVHPPFYYFILKFVLSLFQVFNLTIDSTIIVARFVSVVPFVLLLVLSFFKVRDNWGWLCCGVFAVCLTSMPQLMQHSIKIRMYSWALFFVTVCFVHAYDVIRGSSIKSWVILMLSGVLAAYTHYFAAVSVIFVFLLLLVYFILNNKSEIKKWIFAVIICSTLYFFWIFTLINQLINVSSNYWIQFRGLGMISECIWFIFSPSYVFYSSIEIMGVLLIISYFVIFSYYIVMIKGDSYDNFILNGLFTLILTVLFGIIISILFKPIFVDRYIIPSLGVFWLTFAFLFSKSWDCKKIFIPVLIVVLLVSCMSTVTFIDFEITSNNNYEVLNSFLKQDSIKNDLFIIEGNETHILPEFNIIKYLLKNYHGIKTSEDLDLALNSNKTFWFFSSRENLFQNFTENNITIKKYATYDGIAQDTYPNLPYTIYKISFK